MATRAYASTFVLASAIALMAAWMPWVSYTVEEYVDLMMSEFGGDRNRLVPTLMSSAAVGPYGGVDFDAWHSRLPPVKFGLPNWIVAILAACMGVLAVARERGWLGVSWKVLLGLALYVSVHTAVFLLKALCSASVRAGAVVTLAACLAMVVASVRLRRGESG